MLTATLSLLVGIALSPQANLDPMRAPLPDKQLLARTQFDWTGAKPLPERAPKYRTRASGASEAVEFDVQTGKSTILPQDIALPYLKGALEGFEGTAVVPQTASPLTVIGADNRAKVGSPNLFPWRATCKLYLKFSSGSYIGTGLLIGKRYILTAGHCVFDSSAGGYATRIEAVPGKKGSVAPFGTALMKKVRTFKLWLDDENPDWDIALITLNRDIGTSTGYFGVANYSNTALKDQLVTISGYPGDRDNGEFLYTMSAKLTGMLPKELRYTIDTAGGQSGSGITRVVSNKRYAIGVHAYGAATGFPFNSGPRIDATILRYLQNWMATGT
jgi:V8-like Glu-specific endopeptidase